MFVITAAEITTLAKDTNADAHTESELVSASRRGGVIFCTLAAEIDPATVPEVASAFYLLASESDVDITRIYIVHEDGTSVTEENVLPVVIERSSALISMNIPGRDEHNPNQKVVFAVTRSDSLDMGHLSVIDGDGALAVSEAFAQALDALVHDRKRAVSYWDFPLIDDEITTAREIETLATVNTHADKVFGDNAVIASTYEDRTFISVHPDDLAPTSDVLENVLRDIFADSPRSKGDLDSLFITAGGTAVTATVEWTGHEWSGYRFATARLSTADGTFEICNSDFREKSAAKTVADLTKYSLEFAENYEAAEA
jgi:hypothetical protein